MWDFSIQTVHVIEARRLIWLQLIRRGELVKFFDFAVPGDIRIEEKEKEKIEKYQYLRRDLQKC